VALNEWGLQACVINDEWTPELLWLMFRERSREIARTRRERADLPSDDTPPRRVLSDLQIFKRIPGVKYVPPQPKA
jgi:hypothetical protein